MERPGIHLGVAYGEGGLAVWGTVRAIPFLCFVVEVAAPGLLVVKHHRGEETGKFVNVAVIEGDQIKIVDETCIEPAGLSAAADVAARLRFAGVVVDRGRLGQRARAAGGVDARAWPRRPAPDRADRQRGMARIDRAADPVRGRAALSRARGAGTRQPGREIERPWQDAVNRAVDAIAGLTAVDGATVLTNRYELLAFGAKIVRRKGSSQVEQVTVTEPVEGECRR